MKSAALLLILPAVLAYPSYVRCLRDGEGWFISGGDGDFHQVGATSATYDAALNASATEIAPGQTLPLTFISPDLGRFGKVWVSIRASDSGAEGVLYSDDRTTWQAACDTQLSTVYPIKASETTVQFRAPCNIAPGTPITFTALHSVETLPAAAGPVPWPASVSLTVRVTGDGGVFDPSCGEEPAEPLDEAPMPTERDADADFCEVLPECWGGEGGVGCEDARALTIEAYSGVVLSRWDAEAGRYVSLGNTPAFAVTDERWGGFIHGPNPPRRKFVGDTPQIYLPSDATHEVYRLDYGTIAAGETVDCALTSSTVGPASVHLFEAANGTGVSGFVTAGGSPYGINARARDGRQHVTQGGVWAVSPTSGCHRLFPSEVDDGEAHGEGGEVMNSIHCHDGSGVCLFSNWESDFGTRSSYQHCLHWCALDDPADPTRCAAGGYVGGGPEGSVRPGFFCAEPVTGKDGAEYMAAGHDPLIAEAVHNADGTWTVTVIATYTDGGRGFDKGASFLRKIVLEISRSGPEGDATTVEASEFEEWGSELWRDTVAGTDSDVGCDHVFLDDAGYVWVSTFRDGNRGEHVMEYPSGKLLYTLSGFEGLSTTTSGVATVGGLGLEASMAVVAVEGLLSKSYLAFVPLDGIPAVI